MEEKVSKDEAIKNFYLKVDFICSMELAHKLTPKKAYEMIKTEYKILKSHIKGKGA